MQVKRKRDICWFRVVEETTEVLETIADEICSVRFWHFFAFTFVFDP